MCVCACVPYRFSTCAPFYGIDMDWTSVSGEARTLLLLSMQAKNSCGGFCVRFRDRMETFLCTFSSPHSDNNFAYQCVCISKTMCWIAKHAECEMSSHAHPSASVSHKLTFSWSQFLFWNWFCSPIISNLVRINVRDNLDLCKHHFSV